MVPAAGLGKHIIDEDLSMDPLEICWVCHNFLGLNVIVLGGRIHDHIFWKGVVWVLGEFPIQEGLGGEACFRSSRIG